MWCTKVSFQRTERVAMPRSSLASKRKPRYLLSQSPQITNLSERFRPDADSIQIALLIAEFEQVRLVEDAELFIMTQIGRPLGLFGPTSPVMLVVKEVTMTTVLRWHWMQVSRFATN